MAALACGTVRAPRFKSPNPLRTEDKRIGTRTQPMQSRCIIDDDVISGVGNGAKFILVHGGGCCTLVSKCFPAYRSEPHTFQTSRRSIPLQLPLRYFRVGLRALCARAAMQRRRCTAQADVSRRRSDKVRPSPARHQRWLRLVPGCLAGALSLTR